MIPPGEKLQIGKGASWIRGTFTVAAGQVDSALDTAGTGGSQTMFYLNGRRLASASDNVSGILVAGRNTLLLQVQSRDGGSGKLSLSLWPNSPLSHSKWYFHGGLAGLDETPVIGRVTNWSEFLTGQPWQSGTQAAPELPAFWKSTFVYHHPAGIRETIGLLTDKGLKAGHVWLNGHNLGECPQNVPMYMPECWLKEGDNDLVIFDLNGNKPEQVALTRYEAFSVAAPGGKVAGP